MSDDIVIDDNDVGPEIVDEPTEQTVEANQEEQTTEQDIQESTDENQGDDGYQMIDKEEYGKKVQKRIDKEVRKRKVIENKLNEMRERLSKYEQHMVERETSAKTSALNDRLRELEAKRREMIEVGEFDQSVEDEWIDLKLQQREMKRDEPKPAQQNYAQEAPQIPQAQQDWLSANDWYAKGGTRARFANSEYLAMVQEEGFEPDDPDTYAELDKRLSSVAPINATEPRQQPAPPPAQPNRGQATRGKSPTFTKADAAKMRGYNLNPDNPEHRKAWLENKRGAA